MSSQHVMFINIFQYISINLLRRLAGVEAVFAD